MGKVYTVLLNGNIICNNVFSAETFYERLKGLMFSPSDSKRFLLIGNCNSVHTCFMKYNIDVVCLDNNFQIIKIFKSVKPFRFVLPQKKVCHIFEIPSDCKFNIDIGDILKFIQK
ncbi:MAG: DUF192 domain-containing protein [Endomicrobiaceae bacterium]